MTATILTQIAAPDLPDVLGMPATQLSAHLDAIGVGRHQTKRVFRALHGHYRPLDTDPQFGPRNAARLWTKSKRYSVKHVTTTDAADGALKLLFELEDGGRTEGVLLPGLRQRWTFCVSSQVGCGIGCTFCATGTMGLGRNLRAGEIMAQIHHGIRVLQARDRRMSHVVFMGMGEPLQNYENVRQVIQILTDTRGPCLESRRITVSTVGLPRQMVQFGQDFEGKVQLALSLHAGTDETRRRIIPIARTYSLDSLRDVCLSHPLPGSRHLMFEYVVLPGVNDTSDELEAVARWMRGIRGMINLVPFNPFPQAHFRSPTTEEVLAVRRRLDTLGVPATIRWPRGRQVDAACGQLALRTPASQTSLT